MLVINWMSSRLVTIGPDQTMAEASEMMRDYQVRRLPVTDRDGRLVGIVSDRDVKRAGASETVVLSKAEFNKVLGEIKVKEAMTVNPVTIGQFDTIEEAALLMLEHKISGLPVVDEGGKLCSLITESDIFRALVLLSGVTNGGVQFGLNIPDQTGSIAAVTGILRKHGGRVVSIFTSYDRVAQGRRLLFIRVKHLERAELMAIKEELAGVSELLYILDTREGKKEIFLPVMHVVDQSK